MAVKTYDAKRVVVVVNSVILSGFGDTDKVSVERNEDSFTLQMGTDGEGTRSATNNRSGRFTITLQQSSPANAALAALALIDEKTKAGAFKIEVKDFNFGESYTANTAWFVKPPVGGFGVESSNREWVVETDQLDYTMAGVGIGSV